MEKDTVKVLLVDDEPDILEILSHNLQNAGYMVSTASSGNEALIKIQDHKFDLIVLDVMMPSKDGIETCREIRNMSENQDVLITFLTARGEEYSEVAGFDAGADDYITKPIKPRAFLSRINALLKRKHRKDINTIIDTGLLKIYPEEYIIEKENIQYELPKKEFRLVELLASKPGKVFTRDQLLSRIWGKDLIVGDRTIDVHIRKIRSKLGDTLIKTIKGVGYKMEGS